MIVESVEKSRFFEAVVDTKKCQPKSVSNWLLGDIAKYMNETGKELSQTALTPNALLDLIVAIESGKISNSAGKTVLDVIIEKEESVD